MAPWRSKAAKNDSLSDKVSLSRSPGMYQRHECIAQASACREKAHADPGRHDYWIDEAVVWHQRAIGAGRGVAVTHEISERAIDTEAGALGPPQLARP
jgi:hypothetical protein